MIKNFNIDQISVSADIYIHVFWYIFTYIPCIRGNSPRFDLAI